MIDPSYRTTSFKNTKNCSLYFSSLPVVPRTFHKNSVIFFSSGRLNLQNIMMTDRAFSTTDLQNLFLAIRARINSNTPSLANFVISSYFPWPRSLAVSIFNQCSTIHSEQTDPFLNNRMISNSSSSLNIRLWAVINLIKIGMYPLWYWTTSSTSKCINFLINYWVGSGYSSISISVSASISRLLSWSMRFFFLRDVLSSEEMIGFDKILLIKFINKVDSLSVW